jgi:ABC-type xylose transport system substrate-binding protein
VGNGKGKVPSVLLKPIVVTKSNVSVVVKDGSATWKDICSGMAAGTCPPR